MKRGRKTSATRLDDLRRTLRFLDDPVALEESPLAALPIVQERAQRDFARRTCPVGLSLAAILRESLTTIATDLGPRHPVGVLALRLTEGATQTEVARELMLTKEHLTRRWKPVLLRLLALRLWKTSPGP